MMTMMMLQTIRLFALLAASAAATPPRHLTLQRIVGYEPRTKVTDLAALDLDQKIMEQELFLSKLSKALNVYKDGGHSMSYASLTVRHPNPPASYPKDTQIFGVTPLGSAVSGSLMEDVSWHKNNTVGVNVKILYHTSDVQERYVGCQVGGLFTFSEANHDGCFNDTGVLTFIEEGKAVVEAKKLHYEYNIRLDNNNGRTLQTLSTAANVTMRKGGESCLICPYYEDFLKFKEYYGDTTYADKWIMAAFNAHSTEFSSGRGNADFSTFQHKTSLAEAISKGSTAMSVLMEVIRRLENAVSDCETNCDPEECNGEPVLSIDAAAAFYAGSLEGEAGSGEGKFAFDLADRRCMNFMTCGEYSNEESGISHVNIQIVREMEQLQLAVLQTQCNVAKSSKETIVNYLKVPLIQSVLHYAYQRQFQNPKVASDAEQLEAEGATFTAAILPWVHACNADHATNIYNQMKVGSSASNVDFKAIKRSFESVYPCLGITCGDVGGVHSVNGYYAGAAPCNDGSVVQPDTDPSTSKNPNAGPVVGSLIGVLCAALLGALYVQRARALKRKREMTKRASNIVAVAEIA